VSYIRKLPSGKWQATVRGPDGRRHTFTGGLKTTVRKWATEQEAQRPGEFRDPRLGETRVGEWYARVSRARGWKPRRGLSTGRCGGRIVSLSGRRGRWPQ
jgi:hypothetical protein